MKLCVILCLTVALGCIYQTTSSQHIYYSACANQCEMQSCPNITSMDTAYIFVHAPGKPDIFGAHFRLETDYFGPEDVISLQPGPGVGVLDGDPFQGMTMVWAPVVLHHHPILRIVADQPFLKSNIEEIYGYRIVDARLFRASGDTMILYDCYSIPDHWDCFGGSFGCWCSGTTDVEIGTQSTVEIRCWINGDSYGGTNYEVRDEMNWVLDWNPKWVWNDGCGVCCWEEQLTLISVSVPELTPEYTQSKVTVYPTRDSYADDSLSFFLTAVLPISVRKDSWGGIKSIYNKK